ncbi:hypothetical protein BB561_006874 [Smittium simulii]|uniref:EGF-like domain-containing protein n=1 Tax=Smittium simulii TaxID=133385 RepID=A0A2T9Y0P4_9FUNG|nr:hypothetical protein BB561_006874 [Smittium simulii]
MIFHKSLLLACDLVLTLLQLSVYANEENPECEQGTAKCASNLRIIYNCVDGQLKLERCGFKEECVSDGSNASCILNGPEYTCEDGAAVCVSYDQSGYYKCTNQKYEFRECEKNQLCVNTGSGAFCYDSRSSCDIYRDINKCNDDLTGFYECVDFKWRFNRCGIDEKCLMGNDNKYKCIYDGPDPVCEKGTAKCNDDQISYDECIDGKLESKKCSPGQKCVANINHIKCLYEGPGYPCEQGTAKCASNLRIIYNCVDGQLKLERCGFKEECVSDGSNASCILNGPEYTCEDGAAVCVSYDQSGYYKCTNQKYEFRECEKNQLCVNTGSGAFCYDSRSSCDIYRDINKCNDDLTGFYEECEKNQLCVNTGSGAFCYDSRSSCDIYRDINKCNDNLTGFYECVDFKWRFNRCGINEKCLMGNDNKYKCIYDGPDPVCEKGTAKCNDDQIGYDECIDGKLESKKCSPGQKCVANMNHIKCLYEGPGYPCEQGTAKCPQNKRHIYNCVDGQLKLERCGFREECVSDGSNASCILNGPEYTCEDGAAVCVSYDQSGYYKCANQKYEFRECEKNQLCVNTGSGAFCYDSRSSCDIYRDINKCNDNLTGFYECVDFKWRFNRCGINEKCLMGNDNKYKCIYDGPDPVCEKGTAKCNDDQIGYDECIDGKLESKKCSPGQKCVANMNHIKCLYERSEYICEEGFSECNQEKTGYNKCVNNKSEFNKCDTGEKCVVNENTARCVNIEPKSECKGNISKCDSDPKIINNCVDGKWIPGRCGYKEKCVTNGNNTNCIYYGPGYICKDGPAICVSDDLSVYYECVNKKYKYRECENLQTCFDDGKGAFCYDSSSSCNTGITKCNDDLTGFYECVNSKWRFKRCGIDEKCLLGNGNKYKCANSLFRL